MELGAVVQASACPLEKIDKRIKNK